MKKVLIMMIISTSVFMYGCGTSKVDKIYKSINDGNFSKASEIYTSIEDKSEFNSELNKKEKEIIETVNKFIDDYETIEKSKDKINNMYKSIKDGNFSKSSEIYKSIEEDKSTFYSELNKQKEEVSKTINDFIADYLVIEESKENIDKNIKTSLSKLDNITTELGIAEAKTILSDNKDKIIEYISGLNSKDSIDKYVKIVEKFSDEQLDFSEIENKIAEKEAKKKAEEELAKQKIAQEKEENEELFNNLFWAKTDSITGDITYYSKSEFDDSDNENVILKQKNIFATEVIANSVVVMAGFQKDDWCFFKSIDYNADGKIGEIEFGYNDVNRQVYMGGIFEVAPILALLNKNDLVNIANAKNVTIRFNGSSSYSFDLTEQQIKELRCAMIKTGDI